MDLAAYSRIRSAIGNRQSAIYHFTGVHAWNLPLVRGLRRRGVPVIHTLHDLDPHTGVRYPALIRLWNRLIIASGCHLLVHGQRTREQLIARGVPAERVTYAPLLHGFLGAERAWPPVERGRQGEGERGSGGEGERGDALRDETKNESGRNAGRKVNVLFFGRIEAYKGVEDLLAAWTLTQAGSLGYRLIIAGPVAQGVAQAGSLRYSAGDGVEVRDRRIDDAEADALFRDASLLVLPYRDATQSALIAAAYAYGLPVIVTPDRCAGRSRDRGGDRLDCTARRPRQPGRHVGRSTGRPGPPDPHGGRGSRLVCQPARRRRGDARSHVPTSANVKSLY